MRSQNKQYVRWGDLDAFGHVNNATYLVYAQEARYTWSKMHEMVVARAEVDYLVPIYEGGRFYELNLWVDSIGNSSFVVGYEMVGTDGVIHAKMTSVQVMVSLETKKSRPLSDSEREFLSKYLKD